MAVYNLDLSVTAGSGTTFNKVRIPNCAAGVTVSVTSDFIQVCAGAQSIHQQEESFHGLQIGAALEIKVRKNVPTKAKTIITKTLSPDTLPT